MPQEILNLDAILPEESYVTYKREKHPIIPLSSEHFIELTRQRLRMQRQAQRGGSEESDETINVLQTIEVIHMAVPSIPKDELSRMPITALQALSEAIEQASEVRKPEGAEGNDEGN